MRQPVNFGVLFIALLIVAMGFLTVSFTDHRQSERLDAIERQLAAGPEA